MPHVAYIILAVLGFGFIVFIHELGHFLAAKLFKVKVKAFSLGFPPTILHRQVGETDYRLGVIPLGGYVSMLGEDPAEAPADDPRALPNIRPWKRAVIFLGGVTLNVVSAIVIYMVASVIGIEVTPPVVGGVADPSPAKAAGFAAGDRIVSIDGERLDSFDDIRILVVLGALNHPDHAFTVRVEGRDEPTMVTSRRSEDSPLPLLGLHPPVLSTLGELEPGCPAEQAGLKPGDRILAIDGRPVKFINECVDQIERLPEKPFTITVERSTGAVVEIGSDAAPPKTRRVTLSVDPATIRVPDYGLLPLERVNGVVDGSPAETAGLNPGDYVLHVGAHAYPTRDELTRTVRESQGNPVSLKVWRDGQTLDFEIAPALDTLLGCHLLGVKFGPQPDPPTLTRLGKPGAAADAGIPDMSRLVSIDGKDTKNWRRFSDHYPGFDGKAIEVGYTEPESDEVKTVTVEPRRVPPETFFAGVTPKEAMTEDLKSIGNPVSALGYGLKKIKRVVLLQYESLRAMLNRNVSTQELSGPVRIGVGLYKMAEAGWGRFFSFLGIISVAIALLNAMPVPPLDGGHVMFVVVEKLIRRPVPQKVRSVVTAAGAILLLGLVATAFINDGRWLIKEFVY